MDEETRRCIDDLRKTSSDTQHLISELNITFTGLMKDVKRIAEIVEKSNMDHEGRIRDLEGQEIKCTIMVTTLLKQLEDKHDQRIRDIENWKHTMIGKITAILLFISSAVAVASSWLLSKF